MYVKQLIRKLHNEEYVCVEDDDYNVIAEDDVNHIIFNKRLNALKVKHFYTGSRSGKNCIVIIANR